MTSKISFYKLMKTNLRQRAWLAALTAVVLFLFMPMYSLFTIDKYKANFGVPVETDNNIQWIADTLPGMLNGAASRLLILCIAILAILCAVTGYSYLHSRKKQDFYHGMPVTRMHWFMVSYLTGILIFVIPYIIFGLCTMVVGQINGLLTSELLLRCLLAILGGILGFLICYHVTILAMLMTGQIVTGVLAALVFLSYGEIVSNITNMLSEIFFKTWSYNSSVFNNPIMNSTPGSLFIRTLRASYYKPCSPAVLFNAVVLCLLFLGLSLVLLRFYRAEAAENALAFPKLASVIKIMIVIPTSLFLGVLFNLEGSEKGVFWILGVSILASVLLCLIIEFIYHHDLKKLLSGKISTAISIGSVLLVFAFFQFDFMGYDTYLPKEEKLEGISFLTTSFSNYFFYPDTYDYSMYPEQDQESETLDDYTPVVELAESGIANLKQNITPQEITQSGAADYIDTTLRYVYKGERDVYREYAVDKTDALTLLTTLCENEAYRRKLFPIFHIDKNTVKKIAILDIYRQPVTLSLDMNQQTELLKAYETDVLNADISELQYDAPLGELQLFLFDKTAVQTAPAGSATDYTQNLNRFYVYQSYKNTLTVLEKYGYSFRTAIDPADVISMNYYPNEGSENEVYAAKEIADYQFGNGIAVTDQQEIESLLNKVYYDECVGILNGCLYPSTGAVEVSFVGSSYPNSYVIPDK